MNHIVWRVAMPGLLQFVAMASDLLLLAAVAVCTWQFGVIGLIVGCLLVIPPTRQTGGFFYAWRPSSIRAFWHNWRQLMAAAEVQQ